MRIVKKFVIAILAFAAMAAVPFAVYSGSEKLVKTEKRPLSVCFPAERVNDIKLGKLGIYLDLNESKSEKQLSGKLRCVYEMQHPSGSEDAAVIQPFYAYHSYLSGNGIEVMSDGEKLDFKVFAADDRLTDKWMGYSFYDALESVSDTEAELERFESTEDVKVYELLINNDREAYIRAQVSCVSNDVRMVVTGFGEYRRIDGNSFSVSGKYDKNKEYKIMVLGGAADITVKAFSDAEYTEEADNYNYSLEHGKLTVADMIKQLASAELDKRPQSPLDHVQMYNSCVYRLNAMFDDNKNQGHLWDSVGKNEEEALYLISFDAEFDETGNSTVEVVLPAECSVDNTETVEPLFKLTVLCTPLDGFEDVDSVGAYLDTDYYLTGNNFNFVKNVSSGSGDYRADIEKPPGRDMILTLCSAEKPALLPRPARQFNNIIATAVPAVFMILTVFLIIFVILKRKKRPDDDFEHPEFLLHCEKETSTDE